MALILHPDSERKRLERDIVATLRQGLRESGASAYCLPPRATGPSDLEASTQDARGAENLNSIVQELQGNIGKAIRESNFDEVLKIIQPHLDKILSEITEEETREAANLAVCDGLEEMSDRKADKQNPDCVGHPRSQSPTRQCPYTYALANFFPTPIGLV